MKIKRIALALSALSFFGVNNTYAQQGSRLVLEEIVVTARKREESLQETPVAVTVMNAEDLLQEGVRNLYDLNNVVPNIEVQSANGNAPLANIYIRGIGQRNTEVNIDSGVGIYIDGVYAGRPDGALLDINDLESLQVLRGPQGTLFGKNTTGGALVFSTNKPTEELSGSLEARAGNYDRMDGGGVLNLPLTDTLLSRFSVMSINRDGYVDNAYDGEAYMDEKRTSGIAQLRWLAADTVTLDLNANYGETDQLARPQKCMLVPGVTGWQADLFNTIAIVPATGRTLNDWCADSANLGDDLDVISDLGGKYESTNKGTSLTAEWEVSDDFSVKSISAWRNTEAGQEDELDHTGIPFLHRSSFQHPSSEDRSTDQYTQEFQLTGSAFDDRMQYVSGAFWFSEKTDARLGNFLGPFDPALNGWFFLNSTSTEDQVDNEAWAVYSQVEWSYNDNWRSTFGLRYTDEQRDLSRNRYVIDTPTLDANGAPVIPVGGGLYVVSRPGFEYNPNFSYKLGDNVSDSVSNDDITPMASLQYLINDSENIDDGTVYLTYSEGFLSGGLSESPTGELEQFQPEEVQNWELGVKLDLLDRRLRVNAALFYADYKNRQLTTLVINQNTGSPSGKTFNAAKSTISGLELETTWLATESLQFTLNATFNDGKIDEFDDIQLTYSEAAEAPVGCDRVTLFRTNVDVCPNDRSSEDLPRLPKQTYFVAAQYNWQTQYGLIIPRLQASYKTDIEYCFDATSCDVGFWNEDEQFDLSARLSWVSNNQKWMAALFGSNLTDETYIVGGTALVESSGVGGYAVNAPRMYGAEVKYSF